MINSRWYTIKEFDKAKQIESSSKVLHYDKLEKTKKQISWKDIRYNM